MVLDIDVSCLLDMFVEMYQIVQRLFPTNQNHAFKLDHQITVVISIIFLLPRENAKK